MSSSQCYTWGHHKKIVSKEKEGLEKLLESFELCCPARMLGQGESWAKSWKRGGGLWTWGEPKVEERRGKTTLRPTLRGWVQLKLAIFGVFVTFWPFSDGQGGPRLKPTIYSLNFST